MIICENKYLIYDKPEKKGLKRTIKRLRNILYSVFYSVRAKSHRPCAEQSKMYNVTVLAIFKNEAKYLKEWIEFHKIVGVEHFYLYNNNSEDDYITVLMPYIEAGIVTLLQWPKDHAQMECYQDGITRFRHESKWIALIDIDEFIVPNNTDSIYEFLKEFQNRPAVVVYWKYFGSSGRIERNTENLVSEDFVLSWRKYADIGKCFYNTQYEIDFDNEKNGGLHHFMWANYKGKTLPPVNVFGNICLPKYNPVPRSADAAHFPIQINHYFTKSYNEYLEKKSKGDVYFKENPHTLDYFYEHDMQCQASDYHVYKYLVKLKSAMKAENEK